MPLVEWSSQFSVGVADIDEQHKGLLEMINKLHEAILANHSSEACAEILDEMVVYAAEHFATEEGYMDRLNYPDAAEHKREHQNFAAQCKEFQEDLAAARISLTLDLGKFLLSWLYDHIRKVDMQLGQFILQQREA